MLVCNTSQFRTDFKLRNELQLAYISGISPFVSLRLNLIKDFPVNYTRMSSLWITQRQLNTWHTTQGSRRPLLSIGLMTVVNEFLYVITHRPICNISANCRALKGTEYWKSAVFRQFPLYIGPGSREDVPPREHFEIFISSTKSCAYYLGGLDHLCRKHTER